ncbi:hypothetical protein [Nonomuraea pusilla]|uniref:DUF998 domain-containing protein n=1 Tax=Nonomuraea pusilla TaxID=46177 RepID=A0A1H7QC46_9ACTN|nr:hypothetical protein [Nonomuraea pusilla]SEL45456.1 hypothetical protein SAMN05660976_02493 [Nonomuraea pusilla]
MIQGALLPRLAPAIGLFFLAPLTAEYLMGNSPITDSISKLLGLSCLYGGGALLIREFTRRTGRGWPAMMTLALAYGMIEEAYVTQTLWDSNWVVGAHTLDYGFIPALGLAGPWTMFMVGVHTVFSISTPIAVAETLAGSRRTTPWLGKVGLTVAGVLYATVALGAGIAQAVYGHHASAPQLIGAGVVIAAIIVVGVRLPRRPAEVTPLPGRAPGPWAAGALAMVAGAVFVLLYAVDPTGFTPWLAEAIPLPAWLTVIIYLVLFVAVATVVVRWSHRAGWSQAHRLALAGGAMLTYAWHSFPQKVIVPTVPPTPPTSLVEDLTSNAILTVGAVALLTVAGLRLRRESVSGTAGVQQSR